MLPLYLVTAPENILSMTRIEIAAQNINMQLELISNCFSQCTNSTNVNIS